MSICEFNYLNYINFVSQSFNSATYISAFHCIRIWRCLAEALTSRLTVNKLIGKRDSQKSRERKYTLGIPLNCFKFKKTYVYLVVWFKWDHATWFGGRQGTNARLSNLITTKIMNVSITHLLKWVKKRQN